MGETWFVRRCMKVLFGKGCGVANQINGGMRVGAVVIGMTAKMVATFFPPMAASRVHAADEGQWPCPPAALLGARILRCVFIKPAMRIRIPVQYFLGLTLPAV